MSRTTAIFLVLLSALGFGSIAFFAKVAYASGTSPSALLALRFGMAVLMLAPVVWFKRLPLPRGAALAGYVLMGLLYTAQAQSYFNALIYASSGLVALLLYIYPVLVTVLAVLLGWEKADRRSMVLTAMACLGLAITLGGKLEGQPAGIALGILAAAIYAVYILLGNKLSRDTHPLSASLVILTTAAGGNILMALIGGATLPSTTVGWTAIGAIALFSTGMAIAFFLIGVKVIGASQASILSTLEPVLTLTIGVLFLGEHVSGSQLFGGAMVLLAVTLLAQRPAAVPESDTAAPDTVVGSGS
ncbi:MAG TPA: DMT family transporter [Burkholderiaceae bacterium]